MRSASVRRRGGVRSLFFFQAEDGIRDLIVTGVQTCALPIYAGCSMADMAEIGQVESCLEQLVELGLTDSSGRGITPLTYMNSTAAIKAFCGERSEERRVGKEV